MGNSISYSNFQKGGENKDKEEEEVSLAETLDYISTYYIITMDFQNLKKLHKKEYCEKITMLTSDIIDKKFNESQVLRIQNRIKNGADSEKKVHFSNDEKTLDKKTNCVEIAKFYIKIAHVFSAIVTTINPQYTYKDIHGNTIKKGLEEKMQIPKNAKIEVSKINLCSERINALKGDQDVTNKDNNTIKIHPDICSVSLDDTALDEEPGIQELIDLYYDGGYDIKTGKFLEMTEETQKLFNEDLKRFYTIFTDNEEMPPEINKFNQIKLKDYSKKEKKLCEQPVFVDNNKNKLFAKYAYNLKQMISSVNEKQEELLEIINKLFIFIPDPITKQKVIRINPELTDVLLQDIIEETRQIIIELYLKCETDYEEGVKIYEAIVETQIFKTTKRQIEELEKEKDKLY